ncbi:MFS transporter [Candidatus Liberibacter africanus]|uniref:MFS transporter n=1 Tax=Liberibacter africanus TaxID=34020 RepID=UPI001FD200F8|nr:MFS transporter [Candidatus Liberibacter africanus]
MPSLSKRDSILFSVSLAIFEFAAYIANDMIQPAMLEIVANFNAGIEWVPTSFTAYLAGGVLLQWFFGPLSDIRGRRPVMLLGVIFFIISCFAILFSSSIEQFMFMRFLQGIGLCFIGSVGYATIQEAFEEKICVKIIALMANIALVSPLLGPLVGAVLVNILPWQGMFVIVAIVSLFSFVGLLLFMPETVQKKGETLSFYRLGCDYKDVLKNKLFINGSLAIGLANVPLFAWIALSPVILISGKGLSIITYSFLQVPVLGGLIVGNFTLSYLTEKITLINLIKLSEKPMIIGLIVAFLGSELYPSSDFIWITAGLSLYTFGLGISNACLTRLTLFSSDISKGTVSAAMSMIGMIVFILGIEASKIIYLWGREYAFNLLNLSSGLLWLILVTIFIRHFSHKDKTPTV